MIEKFLTCNKEKRLKIGILGDAVVDEYFAVKVSRISPEFPIQVLHSTKDQPEKALPGGAANVAYQTKHFNVDCQLFCLCTQYSESIFQKAGLQTNCEYVNSVPIKRRFYDGNYALTRWDVEDSTYHIPEAARERLFEKFCKFLETGPDIVILSDYNKGLFTPDFCHRVVKKCKKYNVKTIVDPKKGPVEKWRGCTYFKPNNKEAADLTGYFDWRDQANYLSTHLGCENVLITHGGEGVRGIARGLQFFYDVNLNLEAQSVIGAGDCFSASLAMALSYGFSPQEAVRLAFAAGAVYVKAKYNQPITPYDLCKHFDPIRAKYLEPQLFGKVVFTNGCLDVLHFAHIKLLEYAKAQGDCLVVGINSDESVRRLKGNTRPINPLIHRMHMLASLQMVDFVIPFEEDDPYQLIKRLGKVDVLVKGGDYTADKIIGADLVKEVKISPFVDGLSTTNLIKKIGL